jgi:hypothetical protein
MERQFVTVDDLVNMMTEYGDGGTYTAKYIRVHRAIHGGAFPSAAKLNDGQTSPYIIPIAEAEAWLESIKHG